MTLRERIRAKMNQLDDAIEIALQADLNWRTGISIMRNVLRLGCQPPRQ